MGKGSVVPSPEGDARRLKLVRVMYDSDASEDTVDRGVVADPNFEGV